MRVRVPASSANLGPGFDCFGLAWQLYNEMEFLPASELKISGCPEKFQNENNLAYRAYLTTLEAAGLPPEPVEIRFLSTYIPVCRGLGSSSALIAGGVLAANELHGLGLSPDKLLLIAAQAEGHPDNVAPALRGGLTVSSMENGRVLSASFPLSDKLHFAVLVPDFELSTELARSVLPAQLSRQDAIFNVSRAALLLKALETGDAALLPVALQDRIHEPYRTPLIPGYDRARELALNLGAAGLCISGAGSTLLCFASGEDFAPRMAAAVAEEFPSWRVLPVLPEREGAAVID